MILYYAVQYIEIRVFYKLQALQESSVYKRSDKILRIEMAFLKKNSMFNKIT
jgi:hypothetical protein